MIIIIIRSENSATKVGRGALQIGDKLIANITLLVSVFAINWGWVFAWIKPYY
jgi:hypothetical protein